MRILQVKKFAKWASNNGVTSESLQTAINEIQQGLDDGDLGASLFKKRIGFAGHGKRKSARTIVCFKQNERAIFVYGFAKKEKDNLTRKELAAFKELSKILVQQSDPDIDTAIKKGALMEIKL